MQGMAMRTAALLGSVNPVHDSPGCRVRLLSGFPEQAFPLCRSSSHWVMPASDNSRIKVTDAGKLRAVAAMTPLQASTIAEKFAELQMLGQVAFIPFLTAGDPDLKTTAEAMKLLDSCGADIIELGIPYSDPLADGPVIQAAAARAISKGTNVDSVFGLLEEVAPELSVPIVLFAYYNPILRRGAEKFVLQAKAAGASGLVVPDLPLEETGKLRAITSKFGLELILLTTPTTPRDRMVLISQATQGFLYLVSATGVTGARSNIESRVETLLKDIKQATKQPVAVGFGISKPEHAVQVAEWGADGVIIGSAVVKLLGESQTPTEGLEAVKVFASDIRAALDKCVNRLAAGIHFQGN